MNQNLKPDNPWYYYIDSELIKKRKPCLTGDYVHLHSLSGCYKVYGANIGSFIIMKNHEKIIVPWKEFRCLKGEGISEESNLRKDLRFIIDKINYSISKQTLMIDYLNDELRNLRKTFV